MSEITGADIVGALLRGSQAVTANVPAARIMGGKLPDGVSLPALLVRTVSSTERQTLKRGQTVRVVDRTSVAVRARSYDEQVELIGAVRRCCAGQVGNIGGGQNVAITGAGKGPDLNGPADSFEQTIDFRVSFEAAA